MNLVPLWQAVNKVPVYSYNNLRQLSYVSHYEYRGIGLFYRTKQEAGKNAIQHQVLFSDGKYYLLQRVTPCEPNTPVVSPNGAP